jgi:hypothetical protein
LKAREKNKRFLFLKLSLDVSVFFSPDHRRVVHMSGESMVAITSRDGRVRFIDMQSAQERPTALVGHAASVHCIVVQEDKKRVFTVRFRIQAFV